MPATREWSNGARFSDRDARYSSRMRGAAEDACNEGIVIGARYCVGQPVKYFVLDARNVGTVTGDGCFEGRAEDACNVGNGHWRRVQRGTRGQTIR